MSFVNERISKRIEELAIQLTNIFSVVDTKGEIDISEKVYEIMGNIPYFKENPKDLFYVSANDTLGRKSVVAILRGKKQSKKTVVLIGHTDTVGISDYGELAEYANDPYKLAEGFKHIKLDDVVRKDLESGDFLFGRGIFDMKSGDAVIINLFEEVAKDLDNFEGNLIYAAVCDEEANSSGMLSVVPKLVELQEKEGLEYLALLDTDYITAEFIGDESKNIYIGTVGKLMPSFFVVGKETHVGESFNGIDPNEISSAIMTRVNMNTEFCDIVDGEVSLPPISLYQRDQKPEYSVQVGKTAVLAEEMENKGEIIAIDIHQHKKKLIEENMKKLGIDIVKATVLDARNVNKQGRKFDKILVDVPCSGYGVIRKKPEILYSKNRENIKEFSNYCFTTSWNNSVYLWRFLGLAR